MANCTDCGVDVYALGEYDYCLRPGLWRRIDPAGGAVLCIGCLEGRLGRRTGRWDYSADAAEVSRSKVMPTRRSGRLADRLGLRPLMDEPAWLK